MNFKEDIRPISYIKSHAAQMLLTINNTHRPIVITQNGEAKGVFIDTESYQKMNDAIGIIKIVSQAENDIKNKGINSNCKVFKNVEAKIRAKKNN